jgi:antirestriction protein ArdC
MRAEITDSIIQLIEAGTKGRPTMWDAAIKFGLPVNYKTKQEYSGINVPLLWCDAVDRGLERNEWLTFKQAQELGANVRKGAKGVMCVFFKLFQKEDPTNELEAEEGGTGRCIPMMRSFWLFNVADIDNLPEVQTVAPSFEPIESAEFILSTCGVPIIWHGTKAGYIPSLDEIHMPSRERFTSPVNAYAVGLHEAIHSTGHPSRLARDFSGRFGDESYAFEELIAELGSTFLVAKLGLEGARLENHASYIESWVEVLKNDKNAIFTASRHANAAYLYLMQKAGMSPDRGLTN